MFYIYLVLDTGIRILSNPIKDKEVLLTMNLKQILSMN